MPSPIRTASTSGVRRIGTWPLEAAFISVPESASRGSRPSLRSDASLGDSRATRLQAHRRAAAARAFADFSECLAIYDDCTALSARAVALGRSRFVSCPLVAHRRLLPRGLRRPSLESG